MQDILEMENITAKGCLKEQRGKAIQLQTARDNIASMDLVHLNFNTVQLHSHFYWLTMIIVIMACWLHASAANTVCPNELPQFSPADTPRDKVFLDVQNPVYCNGVHYVGIC